jgi:hypothetical protein
MHNSTKIAPNIKSQILSCLQQPEAAPDALRLAVRQCQPGFGQGVANTLVSDKIYRL